MGFFSTILAKLGIGETKAAMTQVDVEAQMEKRAAANPQRLN